MLYSIYHMTFKIIKNHIFCVKIVKILSSLTQHFNGRHYISYETCKNQQWFKDFIARHYNTPRCELF